METDVKNFSGKIDSTCRYEIYAPLRNHIETVCEDGLNKTFLNLRSTYVSLCSIVTVEQVMFDDLFE